MSKSSREKVGSEGGADRDESAAESERFPARPERHTGRWISVGLISGVLAGVLFGEYCAFLSVIGQAYVGLLQMTVLPYLILSLISNIARLQPDKARKLGVTALVTLLLFTTLGIGVIVACSMILPPIEGASFFSPAHDGGEIDQPDFLSTFIPTNVFRALSREYVPAVVVFCLLFGAALMRVSGKEQLLSFADLCTTGIGRMNLVLVRLAPMGLFALTAAAAGTLQIEELARLQAYLIIYTLACLATAFVILPLLVSSLTRITYWQVVNAAYEPLLTVVATGKLFVVLPQVVEKCEELLQSEEDCRIESEGSVGVSANEAPAVEDGPRDDPEESTSSVLVPLAYSFPHLGKLMVFLFISFAAWYVGDALTAAETTKMAVKGSVSSFASPLISVPFMLDQYELPQDLLALFILPGFVTTRLSDVVGVMHLMALTLLVSVFVRGQIRVQWRRLMSATVVTVVFVGVMGVTGYLYLTSTTLDYSLDDRFLSLEITHPNLDSVTYKGNETVPPREKVAVSVLDRVREERVLRVGYHPDHLPYSYFNDKDHLVGLDIELVNRLADRLDVRLEFVPWTYGEVVEQLDADEFDLALGGLVATPERLLVAGFTEAYETSTVAVVLPDHRRGIFGTWDEAREVTGLTLGALYEDVRKTASRELPRANIVLVDSVRPYFRGERPDLDGVLVSAEEGAAWNVLYPDHAVVVPQPTTRRPVAMATRAGDDRWITFLNRWLEFERYDGSLDRLRTYWVEGGGTLENGPRWCVLRDVLHWIP